MINSKQTPAEASFRFRLMTVCGFHICFTLSAFAGPLPSSATTPSMQPSRIIPATGREAPGSSPAPLPARQPLQSPTPDILYSGVGELAADSLVAQVLARNPSLAQMTASAAAAAARYPQVVSLDDPMFGATVSPRTFGSHEMDGGYRLEVSQKYPWPGKLALHGANAAAEARAAKHDVEDTRLQLIESARDAFADYYLAARGQAVSQEALRLLEESRRNAETLYKTGKVTQQDLLQADVEIGRQRQRQLTLERMRLVVCARINTLLHLPPDAPLPPPPESVPAPGTLPDVAELRACALTRRPDLKALAERVAADQASLDLAHKDYYPDFEVLAAYDDFWSERPLRAQLGVRMNLPFRLAKRGAAVCEAEAKLGGRIAELARLTDEANLAVDQAYAEADESEKTVRLYDQTILPAAEQNVKSAQTYYTTGKIPFLSLIEAERGVIDLRDRYYEAAADAFRRRAALERAVGGPLGAGGASGVEGPAVPRPPCPATPPGR